MTDNQVQAQEQDKPSDKEMNFRRLQEKYERELDRERSAREEAERANRELMLRRSPTPDIEDNDDDQPYVDHKNLQKKFSSFERKMEEKIEQKADQRAKVLLEKERQQSWMRQNPDFYDVMENAEAFAKHDPELAETILQMPQGFERQKLVYKNIKALGLHKPAQKQPSIQDKIDANRKSPYYQPSGVANAPYQTSGDFSPVGQKNAYQKMQELKNKLRI